MIISNTKGNLFWEFKFNGFNNDDDDNEKCTKAYALLTVRELSSGNEETFIVLYDIGQDKIVSLTNANKGKKDVEKLKNLVSLVMLLDVELREYFKFACKIK